MGVIEGVCAPAEDETHKADSDNDKRLLHLIFCDGAQDDGILPNCDQAIALFFDCVSPQSREGRL